MDNYRIPILVGATLSATLWAYACGDGATAPSPPTPDPPRPTTVTVSPATAELAALGATVQLSAEVHDQNGQVMAGATVAWASGNAPVATVSNAGLVTAAGNGTATITATAGSASGTATVTVAQEVPDRAALVALYNATDGQNWFYSDNWLTNAPLRDWYGVRADGQDQIVALNLSRNNLTGPIPPELGNLANLTSLALFDNDLTGPIPPELGNLGNLTWLSLYENDLTGPIPPELGNLGNLTWLSLADNDLTGSIPRSLLQLDRLATLSIGSTDLCVPGISPFLGWLQGIERHNVVGMRFCNATDMAVLKAFHEAAGGPGWAESGGWLSDGGVEEWYGISADSLGRVTQLDLTRNGLAGILPANMDGLEVMTVLRLGGNALSGRLPLSLTRVPLQEFRYGDTQLCAPVEATFQAWLNGIATHEGTGDECAPPSDRDILEALYTATGGATWTNSDNWLTNAPLRDWYGVRAYGQDQVDELSLSDNNLTGPIPPELGNLTNLTWLGLGNNSLTGPIPAELGNLTNLTWLELGTNGLTGPIPPELGNLTNLTLLGLWNNSLTGPVPAELGNLANLTWLGLGNNSLTGPVPAELGNLANLTRLRLGNNSLAGPIPPELGNLTNLTWLGLWNNSLTGPIPPELGNLSDLRALLFANNDLSGPVPPTLGGIAALEQLVLSGNPGMGGTLPSELTSLRRLEALLAEGTDLCTPLDPGFQAWLGGVRKRRIAPCVEGDPPMAYLTQAVQSREFPVPLVAGERALLRVFPTARQATSTGIPAIRARFYLDGRETHVEDIPGKSASIPTEVDESSLSKSANAEIPGDVVQPGLEMVIEIDPEGTLDASLGVARRIPEMGRLIVEVRAMPLFGLTLIPFIWTETQDSSIVDLVGAMTADLENHEMLRNVGTLLPVGDLVAKAHEPVLSTTNNSYGLLSQTRAIRVMEGGSGHYLGLMSRPTTGPHGLASAYTAFSLPHAFVIGHELGHTMGLDHAPACTTGDPSYPDPDGYIGTWGYDFRDGGKVVPPFYTDLMGYCNTRYWISDYHFTNAARFRLFEEGAASATSPAQSLLLWGGANAEGQPFLEPAFVVDAPAVLPDSVGQHRITGRTANGRELFSLGFTMPEVADGDESSGFAFVLPVRPGWEGELASIMLDGPGGSFTLDGESDQPVTILRNLRNGQVRGILRDLPGPAQTAMDAATGQTGPGLEVLFSRGIPGPGAWRR